jgi:hypothetical protein
MKLPVVGGMTQAEGVALGAFVTSGDRCRAVPDYNLGIHGVLLENGALPLHPMHVTVDWRAAGERCAAPAHACSEPSPHSSLLSACGFPAPAVAAQRAQEAVHGGVHGGCAWRCAWRCAVSQSEGMQACMRRHDGGWLQACMRRRRQRECTRYSRGCSRSSSSASTTAASKRHRPSRHASTLPSRSPCWATSSASAPPVSRPHILQCLRT